MFKAIQGAPAPLRAIDAKSFARPSKVDRAGSIAHSMNLYLLNVVAFFSILHEVSKEDMRREAPPCEIQQDTSIKHRTEELGGLFLLDWQVCCVLHHPQVNWQVLEKLYPLTQEPSSRTACQESNKVFVELNT
jgi:hypothetical protein